MDTQEFRSLFAQQADALAETVPKLRQGRQANERLKRLLRELANAPWRASTSLWDSALVPNETTWWDLLKLIVEQRGRAVFALSHSGGSSARGFAKADENARRLEQAEWARLALELLASYLVPALDPFRTCKLNILVIDNKPNEIREYSELLNPGLASAFWKFARWWKYDGEFSDLRDSLVRGNLEQVKTSLKRFDFWNVKDAGSSAPDLQDIDLVLQDQFLGERGAIDDQYDIGGLDLTRYYYERMPQALVFLTTGLDVQSIVTLSRAPYVDRIVPKRHLAALPWYYYIAFCDVMGSMFWESWVSATEEKKQPGRTSTEKFFRQRSTLRNLLGSIRRWQREPEILWHGQALAEMVDHGNEHISDLWRLTDEVLGARKGDQQPVLGEDRLTTAERVLVALGVWLHDIGHRGDEFSIDPAGIRDVHGSISEWLLLQDASAFGLEWLKSANDRPGTRNDLNQNRPLSPLRQVAVLCRHHQSSAPLFRERLAEDHYALKLASDYSRIALRANGRIETEDVLAAWRNDAEDLDWAAHDVRVLEDFQVEGEPDLLKSACLLRLFDAMNQTHRRAGSLTRMATHRLYRDNRRGWAERRKREIQRLLTATEVGSKSYLALHAELLSLWSYQDILDAQDVHLWRQYVVRDCRAECKEADAADGPGGSGDDDRAGKWCRIEVHFTVCESGRDLWEHDNFREFRDALLANFGAVPVNQRQGGDSEIAVWRHNFVEDALRKELSGQKRPRDPVTYLAINVFKDTDLTFFLNGQKQPFYSLHEASRDGGG